MTNNVRSYPNICVYLKCTTNFAFFVCLPAVSVVNVGTVVHEKLSNNLNPPYILT